MFMLVIEFLIHNGRRSVSRIQLIWLKNNGLRSPGEDFFDHRHFQKQEYFFGLIWIV